MARPTKLDSLTIKKLEEAFVLGASINEACFNANISKQTFYNWKDENPELFDHFEQLRQAPILKARKCVVNALEKNPTLAMRYLERKLKSEFGNGTSDDKTDKNEVLELIMASFQNPNQLEYVDTISA